jgi:uroporphyrinogen-III synthase
VLVFTSPLSAQTYLSHQKVKAGQHVVAIGQPTAVACQAAGASPWIAAAPNEAALAKIVLDCLKSRGSFS